MTTRHLSRRALACATAGALGLAGSGLLVSPADAATGNDVRYSSTTGTAVVGLALNLPSALPALPGLGKTVDLTLLGTTADDLHGADATQDVASATSTLAGGSLVTSSPLASLLSPLQKTLTADLKNPGTKTSQLAAVPTNALGLAASVGDQVASLTAATRLASSAGKVADVQLGSLASLGLGATLTTALAQLNDALATVTSTATPLTNALGALPALPSVSIPNPLAGVLPGLPATISTPTLSGATLTAAINELPAQIAALEDRLLNGSIVDLKGLGTLQSIAPTLQHVAATGSTKVGTIDLFGGLVSVVASDASVSATSATTHSAASSSASATLLSVKVADSLGTLLQAIASDKGLTLGLLDGTLGQTLDSTVRPTVQTVDTALNTVLGQVTDLLASLDSGAKLIKQGTTSQKVSADGRTAEAHATPASVTLGLPTAPDLLTLSLGKADAYSSMSVAAPAVVVPPTVTSTPTALPRTGGNEGVAALAGLLLLGAGGAAVARRRSTRTV